MNNLKITFLFLILSSASYIYSQNVGIGTTTPQEKLHVAGSFRVDDLQTATPSSAAADKIVWVDANGKMYTMPVGLPGRVLGINGAGFLSWLNPGLSSTLNNGQIWIGDAGNAATPQTPSGDALISNSGVITIQDNAVDGTDITISGESNGSLMYFNGTNWISLGIGTPGQVLSVSGGVPAWITPTADDWKLLGNTGTNAAINFIGTTDGVDFVTRTNNTERMRIMSDGRVKIGGNNAFKYGLSALEVQGDGIMPHISYASSYPSFIMMRHNGTNAAPTSLSNGDNVGELRWYGHNGTTYMQTARILSYVDGPITPTSVPGNLRFMTNTIGNNLTDEKMIITNDGKVGIGTASIGTPVAPLHIYASGANWNLASTNGDFYIGDLSYRLKVGVATGGGGAGDVYFNSNGGTNRLFFGGGNANTQVLTVNGTNGRTAINLNGALAIDSRLDINGDLALREGAAINVAAGTNAITLTGEFSHYRLTAAAGAFNINTIAGGNDGQLLTLINATGQIMTINNNNAANGILTGTGANLVSASANNNAVSFIFNSILGRWIVVSSTGMSMGSSGWQLTGNAGTAAATNFIGTTDAQDFVTRANNVEAMRVTMAQRVGIGTTTPATRLEVNSGTIDAIYGHSTNVGGYLGYETNFTAGTAGALQGAGVWATNATAGYTTIFAQSTGSATVAANIAQSNVWIASYNLVDNASAIYNPSGVFSQLNNTSTTMGAGAFKNAIYGYSNRGTTTGNPGYTVGLNGIANSQNEDAIGVVGRSFCNSGFTLGGYFEGNNYAGTNIAYAYVGGNDGFGATKITGTGSVAEIVPTPNHGRVKLFCPEAPEYWYQDYGSVNLVNGVAHVELDPILAEIIVVNDENPIRVFATPVNMLYFEGVTITNQTATGFDLVELNGAKHTGKLDYQLICKPKTNYGQGRFPQGRGPAWLKPEMEPAAAKAANQPKDIFYWPADYIQYNYNPEDMVPVGEIVPAGPNAGKFKLGNGKYSDHLPVNKSELSPR